MVRMGRTIGALVLVAFLFSGDFVSIVSSSTVESESLADDSQTEELHLAQIDLGQFENLTGPFTD